jgi:hypothetical protein
MGSSVQVYQNKLSKLDTHRGMAFSIIRQCMQVLLDKMKHDPVLMLLRRHPIHSAHRMSLRTVLPRRKTSFHFYSV